MSAILVILVFKMAVRHQEVESMASGMRLDLGILI